VAPRPSSSAARASAPQAATTPSPGSEDERGWYAYVLVSFGPAVVIGDQPRRVLRTYVGIALDVARRVRQHNGELAGGARSTRAWRPWRVAVTHGPYLDRGRAQAVEYELKRRRGAAARLRPL
jgi:putative endonuclease